MREPKIYTCENCGADFEHATSGKPKACLPCRAKDGNGNRSRDLQRLVEREGVEAAQEILASVGATKSVADQYADAATAALTSERFAVCLGLCGGDVRRAADLAGLANGAELSDDDLNELAEKVKAEQPGFFEGRSADLGATISRTLMLLSLRLAANTAKIPASQLPAAIKALAQTSEGLGLSSHAYATINVVISQPGK